MNITRYEPRYRPLGLLGRLLQEQDFDYLLSNTAEPDTISDWRPAVDIREEDQQFCLKADLPGVNPEDIGVSMEDGVLTIQGERSTETDVEKDGYQRFERISGRFLRRFSLPDTADGEQISATSRNGVLEITIPKQIRPQPRRIDVEVA